MLVIKSISISVNVLLLSRRVVSWDFREINYAVYSTFIKHPNCGDRGECDAELLYLCLRLVFMNLCHMFIKHP